jgi:prevent-host-death family protein
MSRQVNIHEAKTHFSKLVEEVEAGGEITIARAGKPVLKLVKIEEPETNRKLGWAKHLFKDFDWESWDAPDEELAAQWEKSLNQKLDLK